MQYEFHRGIANIVQASIKNSHGQQIVTTTYPNISQPICSAVYTGKWKQMVKEEEATCSGTRTRGSGGGRKQGKRRR
jgi:hypothetical protein